MNRIAMLSPAPSLKLRIVRDCAHLEAAGVWTAATARFLEASVDQIIHRSRAPRSVEVDIGCVEELDTYGAWLIERLGRHFASSGASIETANVPLRFKGLLDAIRNTSSESPAAR